MTKEKPATYLVAFTKPLAGSEDAFNEWYDNVHLPEVVAVKGFISGRRFKLSEHQVGGVTYPVRYAVIYEVEAGSSAAVLENLTVARQMFTFEPVIDRSEGATYLIESIGDTFKK